MAPDAEFDSHMVVQVLQYFLRNRDAADDLEGVLRFRLLDEAIRQQLESVRLAIDWLVSHEILSARPVAGRGAVYSLNHSQVSRALQMLEWLQSGDQAGSAS